MYEDGLDPMERAMDSVSSAVAQSGRSLLVLTNSTSSRRT